MRSIVALFLLGASTWSHGGGWTDPLKVVNVIAYGDSNMIVAQTEWGAVYATGCVVDKWVIEGSNADGSNRVYSALLTALVSGQSVEFWYLDSCGAWDHHATTIVRVQSE